MTFLQSSWQFWAILAAFFAALTAIFAKVGVTHVNSDFATFVRVIVVMAALAVVLRVTGHWQAPPPSRRAPTCSSPCPACPRGRRGSATSGR